MKIQTHILMTLMALVLTACASKENISQSKAEQQEQQQEEYSKSQFESASRFR